MNSPKKLSDKIWHFLSKNVEKSGSNSYLIENGSETVLIDPCSINDIEELTSEISKITSLKNIKYIILHHQAASICSGVPYLEKIINRDDLQIIGHSRQESAIRCYGIKSKQYLVDKNSLTLNVAGLSFITTPYCHSPGSFVTHHKSSGIVFTSTLFSNTHVCKEDCATKDDIEDIKQFHREHIPTRDILNYALNKLEVIDVDLIAPQFGALIEKKMIKKIILKLRVVECGIYVNPDYITSLSLAIEKLWQSEAKLKKQKHYLNLTVMKKTKDLQIANIELLSALEAKSEFIASVSHELRTPLNPIINFSEYLLDEINEGVELTPHEYKKILKKIYKHSKKLNKMINVLLEKK